MTDVPITKQQARKDYMNNYNKTRKDDDYYILMKRLNNKLSYLRKHHNLTDDTPDYTDWKLLYPELVSITETLNNIKLIIANNKNYSHLKSKLYELIDTMIPDEPA
jgi:hypothetical protein